MLSRVADSVYWMSRYVERAENVARFIDVNNNLTLGEGDGLEGQWSPLVYTTGDQELFDKKYDGDYRRQTVVQFLAFDRDNPNSILSCVERARENARTIREVISITMWEELNKFFLLMRDCAQEPSTFDQLHEFCTQVRRASHSLIGATEATMSHDEAWNFARMGRLLERADKTSRIVDVQYFLLLPDPSDVGSSLDVVRWTALLKSATALAMYRRVHGRILPSRVAEYLILDRFFPRAVHFCLIKAHESLQTITGSVPGTFQTRVEQRMGRLRSHLDYISGREMIERGLHQFIDDFQTQLNQVGDAVLEDFFTRKPIAHWTQASPGPKRGMQQQLM